VNVNNFFARSRRVRASAPSTNGSSELVVAVPGSEHVVALGLDAAGRQLLRLWLPPATSRLLRLIRDAWEYISAACRSGAGTMSASRYLVGAYRLLDCLVRFLCGVAPPGTLSAPSLAIGGGRVPRSSTGALPYCAAFPTAPLQSHELLVFGPHPDRATSCMTTYVKTYAAYATTIAVSTALNLWMVAGLSVSHEVALVVTTAVSVVWSYYALALTWRGMNLSRAGSNSYVALDVSSPDSRVRGRAGGCSGVNPSLPAAGFGGARVGMLHLDAGGADVEEEEEEEESGTSEDEEGIAVVADSRGGGQAPSEGQIPLEPCVDVVGALESGGRCTTGTGPAPHDAVRLLG